MQDAVEIRKRGFRRFIKLTTALNLSDIGQFVDVFDIR